MKWKLQEQTEKKRLYIQETTGTQLTTELIYTDRGGVNWWGFTDLFSIPYIRIALSKQINDLFTAGLSLADIKNWCAKEKALIKSNDPEKYEKLYAMVLEKEAIAENTADPLQKHLALCTVYIMREDERIDYFTMNEAEKKIELWKLDSDSVAFFLNWHTGHIDNYTKAFRNISQIALNQPQNQGQNL